MDFEGFPKATDKNFILIHKLLAIYKGSSKCKPV